ncbi:UAA transporter [Parasitella parasitica]|nr:UAA transporter [Parasitella parasitica]
MNSSDNFKGALIHMIASDMPMILALIFGGCCSQLITFGQFLFVAVEGLRNQITWGKYGPKLKPTVVPLTNWLFLVIMFFIVSILNNLALGYNISVPLHIIFRSGGLIVNMILGALIMKKRYSLDQIIGVLFVTAGVIWATLDNASTYTENNPGSTTEFIIGILLLLVAMILSAGMGLFQEVTYKKYGKEWREGLFYTHFLAIPLFLLFYQDLYNQVIAYNKSPLMSIPALMDQVPFLGYLCEIVPTALLETLQSIQMRKLWAFLLMNMLTQYVCIAGVNRMTSVATSLTLNLVLNLRKFSSLMFSIIYFKNDFCFGAKMGSLLVFVGTLIYTRAGLQANSRPANTTVAVAAVPLPPQQQATVSSKKSN